MKIDIKVLYHNDKRWIFEHESHDASLVLRGGDLFLIHCTEMIDKNTRTGSAVVVATPDTGQTSGRSRR